MATQDSTARQPMALDDIAVVGIGLRFPGDATSPERLWTVLERGESQWSEFPADRLNIDGYFHPSGDRQGSISFRGAHFLSTDVAAFDAPFFSVSADDAKAVDPQQRMLLEVSYEALENAGIRKEEIDGSDTSVFVGSFVKDYEQICLRDPDWQPQYAATGNGIAIMANRISYAFNFHGPSMTIDTGCSGSLVAVHLAAQSLRNGESSLALAAGAGMILTPNTIMPMTALNFLSPDGKCFTFDSRANGYGRGEGIGVVVLKRLPDALRDNDTIRAVIRGSRVNQDGRTTGITLPSKEAQVANIRAVYKSAGLTYEQTGYVECHGTGTQAGDWRELKAISETLASARGVENPIVVGSVKPNIGHLEGAAGIAGLIKGVLALEHGKVPPNINFERGNPDIDFVNWKVKVPQGLMDWPLPGTRRVSVNCFGFGGTNAHVIMDEAPAYLASHDMAAHHNSIPARPCTKHQGSEDHQSARSHLFCFSSIEKLGVKRVMRSYLDHLQAGHASSSDDFLQNLAYTLGCRRSTMEWKGAIVAESTDDLVAKLRSVDESTFKRSSRDSSPPICFVFCGQGSQWAGMGRDLIDFEAFRESLEAASYFMSIYLESRFNLLEELFATEHESRISESEVSQPATTALQVALVDLLAALSIKPKYVVGHSSGEIAAAYASGFITRETAWEVAYHRGAAAASLALKAPTLKGSMLAVGMSLEEATTYIEPINNFVQVACINSPHSVTLSGRAKEISSIANELRGRGVFSKLLPVGTAYHSKHMKLVEHEYGSLLRHIGSSKKRPQATMYSSVTSHEVNSEQLGASYWVDNMVSPVNYVGALQEMMKLPCAKKPRIFVEIGPRPSLRTPTLDTLTDVDSSLAPNLMSALERGVHGETSLLRLAGNLWALGHSVDLKYAFVRGRQQQAPKCLADLPPYPWNHDKTYWHESHLGEANRFRKHPRQDLIGAPTADSIPFQPRWRGFLRISENPWLQDHQVQKTIIYPAAGMVAMALEAAKQVSDEASGLLGYEIVNMKIERAMLVPSTSHGLETAFNMNFSNADTGSGNDGLPSNAAEFSIYSKQLGSPWERNASGSLRFRFTDDSWQEVARMHEAEYNTASATCTERMVPRQLYELLDTVGMNYGSLFQNIVDIRKGRDSCVSKIRIPDTKAKMPARFEYPHVLHPATLDSMFQTLFAIEPSPMVPTFVEFLFVSADLANAEQERGECFVGRAAAQRIGVGDAKANITMKLEGTQSHVIVKGLVLTGLASSAPEDGGFLPNHRNLCTEIVWKEDVDFSTSFPGPLLDYIQLWVHKHPGASILQVGGASDLALTILDRLSPAKREPFKLSRFTIANLDSSLVERTLKLISDKPVAHVVEAVKIDGSEPLADFDLILVDPSVDDYDTGHLEKHLKPHGRMLAVAGDAGAARDKPWGDQESTSPPRDNLYVAMLYSHRCTINIRWLMNRLLEISVLKEFGGITVIPISDRDVERDPSILSDKIVLSLLDFEKDVPCHGFVFEWSKMDFDLFHTVQKTAKGIVWLTQGAQMDCSNARAAPIVGLARTLMSEDPLKTIVTLDLDEGSRVDSREICSMILFVLFKTFREANKGVAREMEYAARGGKLYIPRLDIVSSLNEIIEGGGRENIAQVAFRAEESSPTTLALTVTKPGLTDRGICFTEFGLPDIGPHDVEIAFDRAILSFPDLENALGRTTQPAIGMDVVGRIVRKGRSVADLEIGAQVMALVPGGAVESSIVTNSCFVAAFQPGTVPSCLISAYYALYRVGRLENGGTALVHAGAGIYGLAALQLCKLAGVEVFLTLEGEDVAGQREILERFGVQSDYIIDASLEGFVDVIMQRTGGRGVDVVYNPTQEHVNLSAACVRRHGTVVQAADKSASPGTPRAGLACGTIVNWDLAEMVVEDATFVAELFEHAMQLTRAPNPFVTAPPPEFDVGQVASALRYIEQAPYLHHAWIVAGKDASSEVPVLRRNATASLRNALDPAGTYLLAGGLGGLGRSICELLVSNGARNLAFLSRSGAASPQSRAFLQDLANRGVNTQAYSVDICDRPALQAIIEGPMARDLPPIRGVFQCAAVIQDSIFDNMTFEAWTTAARPKMSGSWNLAETIKSTNQDPFLIFLASSSGVIGSRSQANYAAGNCFEDALAHSLRAQGRHAVSIDLGPVLGAGMLAEDEGILSILRGSGFYGIRHEDFLKVVEHAITMETVPGDPMPAQVILGVGTGGLMLQNQPADPYWSRTALYSHLNLVDMPPSDLQSGSSSTSKQQADLKAMLACCTDAQSAAAMLSEGLMRMLAKATNMLFEEMDPGRTPSSYGVDSLVAVGVRNWVLGSSGVEVSVFEVLSDQTISDLAAVIADRGGFGVNK